MNTVLKVFVGFCLVATSLAQDNDASKEESKHAIRSPEAIEILKKVDQATKNVKSVRYDAEFTPIGTTADQLPKVRGRVVAANADGTMSNRFVCHSRMKPPGSDGVQAYTVGSDGDIFYLIDESKKTVYADIDRQVLGRTGQLAAAINMREWAHPTPFADEIKAREVELQGLVKIGGVECYKIHVVYRGQGGEAVWYFSTKDHLPRRCDRVINFAPAAPGGTQLVLTNVVPNVKVDHDSFKLVIPDGFERTDRFAP